MVLSYAGLDAVPGSFSGPGVVSAGSAAFFAGPGGPGTFPLGSDAPPDAIEVVCTLSDIPPASSFNSFSLAPVPVLPGVKQWKVTKNKKTRATRRPRLRQVCSILLNEE
jgi:hypothetical protein